ncbi:MAG: hypothetical protein WA194_01895 [Patescibacteria group bacterium]
MDVSQFEKFAEEASKSSSSVSAVIGDASLAALVRTAEDPNVPFEEINERIRSLVITAKKNRDWKWMKALASGNFEYLDSLDVPMKSKDASVTPLAAVAANAKKASVPAWIVAYAKLTLSLKENCESFLACESIDFTFDPLVMRLIKRESEIRKEGSKKLTKVAHVAPIKFTADAVAILEKEVRDSIPHVTRNPAFFLLLAGYETLHANGYRPAFFRNDASLKVTYLDLVQALLELFPEDARPDVHEYLAQFRSSGDEIDFRSSLMSRITYEGDMERMVDRGRRRQAAVDGLMARIKTAIGEKAES